MTSDSNNEQIRHLKQRININLNAEKDNAGRINHRHSIAYINFRKAVYRSLLLNYHDEDEYNSIISYIKYCIQIFFLCLCILLISALIKFLWCLYRHY